MTINVQVFDLQTVQLISGKTCFSKAVVTLFYLYCRLYFTELHESSTVACKSYYFLMVSIFTKYYAFFITLFSLRPHERIASGMRGLNSWHHISGFDEQNQRLICGQFCRAEGPSCPQTPLNLISRLVVGIVQPLAGPKFCFEHAQSCRFLCISCLEFCFSSSRALLLFS